MIASASVSRELEDRLPQAEPIPGRAARSASQNLIEELPPVCVDRIGAVLQAREPIDLPPQAGPTLRGGFGRKLFAHLCPRSRPICRTCDLINDCAYGLLFETPEGTIGRPPPSGRYGTPPHPFLIRWCADVSGPRPTGTRLALELVLLEPAGRFLSELKIAVRDLARSGLGRGLSRCDVVGWTGPFSVGSDEIEKPGCQHRRATKGSSEGEVELTFLTPLRIHRRGRLLRRPTFADIAVAARRRIRTLAALYGAQGEFAGGHPRVSKTTREPDPFLSLARRVETVRTATRDVHCHRRSGRSGAHQNFEGVSGRTRFRGPIRDFLPWLKLGEVLGIGKGVSLGFGHYRIAARQDEGQAS